jgi:hypothetical protein
MVPLLLQNDFFVSTLLAHRTEIKPALKLGGGVEDVGQKKVQQAPQLAQVVLQRRSCNRSLHVNTVSLP